MRAMSELLLDAFTDTLKYIPILFLCYLFMEYMEHAEHHETSFLLNKNRTLSAVLGSLLGLLPQCGFSVAAASLYARRLISTGVLIAILISTSDEAVLLLISAQRWKDLTLILLYKFLISIFAALFVDRFYKNKEDNDNDQLLDYHKEHCEHGILKEALLHTLKISLYILAANIIMNLAFESLSDTFLNAILLQGSVMQIFPAALVGFFPSCAASVFLSTLYLKGTLSFAAFFASLITIGGLGYAALFKNNKDPKTNLRILIFIYMIAVIAGLVLYL